MTHRPHTHPTKGTLSPRKAMAAALLLWLAMAAQAQTPVANRVKAMAKQLPYGCEVVAKYTDNERHCLYYTQHERLYRYNVLTNKKHEVRFSPDAYSSIVDTYVTEKGDYVFVCVEKNLQPKKSPENTQELWRIDTKTLKNKKIGDGFAVEKHKGCFIIKKVSRVLESPSQPEKKQWMVQDHYYFLDGRTLWAKDEYLYKEPKKKGQ